MTGENGAGKKRGLPWENIRIETPRLLLRRWRESDGEDLFRYAQSPVVGPMAGWAPHKNIEESRALVQVFSRTRAGIALCIEEKESGRVIGSISLAVDTRRPKVPGCAILGYALSEERWGRGYMTEAVGHLLDYAFRVLKRRLITVTHYPENSRSRRVIEKSGFRFEGWLRSCALRYDGTVTDLLFYSLTAGEYYGKRAGEAGLSLKLPEEASPAALAAYRMSWGGEAAIPHAMALSGLGEDEWLRQVLQRRTASKAGVVPSTLYLLTREGGEVLGALELRHGLNDDLLVSGGHIEFGLAPQARSRGLGPLLLGLGLMKARELGIYRALLVCDDRDVPAAAVIRDCGGVLENLTAQDGRMLRRYWVHQ